ncbi:MAG: 50S ribosomal protein L23 [Desulfovibrionaceae bacterium]|nr:50S ribosomal protein L23 [Desulfovibrionaceae bacterium]
MDYTKILLRPVVTEKATLLRDSASQFAFFVHPKANRIEIGKAVEEAFKVKVVDVNVVTVKPRNRVRQGRVKGRIPGCRKAYVTLAPGDKIEFFEGV